MGRHRSSRALSGALTRVLTVAGLLAALGLGAAGLLTRHPTTQVYDAGLPAADHAASGSATPPASGADAVVARVSGARRSPAVRARSSGRPSRTVHRAGRASRTATDDPPTRPAVRVGAADSGDFAALEAQVVDLTNGYRRRYGCPALTVSPALRAAARLHVRELARHDGLYLSHRSDDGRSFVDRAHEQGYPDPGAENLARGQRSPAEVLRTWMASDDHRANILDCRLRAIGVGAAVGDGSLVWGQLFGKSSTS